MGSQDLERKTLAKDQRIVAFDFDGTLTVCDSFNAFLKWKAGPTHWYGGLMKMLPDGLTYVADRDRGRIKAAAIRTFLKNMSRGALETEAALFCDQVWDDFIRPDALACWNDWGRRSAHRVIVTASPETTVAPFARRLGAENLIGTLLAFDADDRITGDFASANCRAAQKVRRLETAYGPGVRLVAAYGDTSGDTEMLAIADQPGFRVFTARPSPS